jgi:hypothetical protein
MSTEASAIPEDIMQTAKLIADGMDDCVKDFDWDEIQLVVAKAILAEREKSAAIAEQLQVSNRVAGFRTARLAVTIAARAIRRGRHLTAAEKLQNVQNWLAEETA